MDELEALPAEEVQRLKVFLPGLYSRARSAIASGQRFVHYTPAAAAMNMIRNREMWLRNTQCMNDFSEVRHGLELLEAAYRSPAGQRLVAFFEQIYPGFRQEVTERFDGLSATIKFDTFIGCLSEHDPAEDSIGRLSMWRAYSGTCGIAFVLNRRPLLGPENDAFGLNTGPVLYARREAFLERFHDFVANMLTQGEYVAGLGAERACRNLFGSYYFGALSTKHPGFAEEREWRMVFNPVMQPSQHLVRSVEICRGEPQIVYRLPLCNKPEAGITGVALAEILEALIIGPCANPRAVREAFVELLADAGVAEAGQVVRISDIPIR